MKAEIAILALLIYASVGFLPSRKVHQPPTILQAKTKDGYSIQYSSNFHRHVVCKGDVVKESFLWLDEAIGKYPNAEFLPLSTSASFQSLEKRKEANERSTRKSVVAISEVNEILERYDSVDIASKEAGTSPGNMYRVIQTCRLFKGRYYAYELDSTEQSIQSKDVPLIAGGGLQTDSAYNITTETELSYRVNVDDETMQKFESVINNLDAKLQSSFFDKFPVADQIWIRERIIFFLAPQPYSYTQEDWVVKFCNEGCGVGLTESQTVAAILALRHLLQFYPSDSNSGKPSALYFYQQLKLDIELSNEARIELNYWLSSACAADLLSFTFLHSLGVSWDQCRIMLDSLSASLVSSELEPDWELSTSRSSMRNQLRADAMNCFRMRLRLSPSEVYDIIKVNKQMSYYSECKLTSSMDHLQAKMLLSSQDLKTLVNKCPTILGYTTSKVDKQLGFLSTEVNLTMDEIRKACLIFPSLMCYGVESNLKPKITFFRDTIGLSTHNVSKMVLSNPSLLGRSLNKTISPTIGGLSEKLGLSVGDIRDLVIRMPQILLMNWDLNLKQKLDFLQRRLGLSEEELSTIFMKSPYVFAGSIVKSLEPKLKILEEVSDGNFTARDAIIKNPALLLGPMKTIERRLKQLNETNATFAQVFDAESKTSGVRRKKEVLELVNGTVVRALPSVEAAALEIGTGKQNMYNIIKAKREFNGKYYRYGSIPSKNIPNVKRISSVSLRQSREQQRRKSFLGNVRASYVPDKTNTRLVDLLKSTLALTDEPGLVLKTRDPDNLYFAVFVASTVFPPKKVDGLRGRRKAGGSSLYVPQLQGSHRGAKLLRTAAERCFSNLLMPSTTDTDVGTNYADATMLLGYPYNRPSKNRCGLYACREALRLAIEVLQANQVEGSKDELKEFKIHVDVFTDSNYAWEIVKNSDDLKRWGEAPTRGGFEYDGSVPKHRVNTDILYPLSRTYFRMVEQDFLPAIATQRNIRRVGAAAATAVTPAKEAEPLAKEITVQFRHTSEVAAWCKEGSRVHKLAEYSEKAAMWQYERAYVFPVL
ncbi:unnamed protein product [Cylindrotheca closterium]|uniref:Uncharacterized protein n=1 Tax=Cylindrotheca closterium TaxID=2856 RepID=A0AAD2G5I8_9STRA|nr:unnamed protein product [Cylindrotheca closterium]